MTAHKRPPGDAARGPLLVEILLVRIRVARNTP
jgi:hypothetical protein